MVAEQILVDLQDVADAMMGGWLVYAQEVLVGQINDDELFVKTSPFADSFAPDVPRRPPYPGARPALVVDADLRGRAEWLHALLAGTVEALRPRQR